MHEFSEFPLLESSVALKTFSPHFPPPIPIPRIWGQELYRAVNIQERERLLIGVLLPQPCSPPYWMPLNANIHGEHPVFLEGFLPLCERFQLSPVLLPEGASLPQLEILL